MVAWRKAGWHHGAVACQMKNHRGAWRIPGGFRLLARAVIWTVTACYTPYDDGRVRRFSRLPRANSIVLLRTYVCYTNTDFDRGATSGCLLSRHRSVRIRLARPNHAPHAALGEPPPEGRQGNAQPEQSTYCLPVRSHACFPKRACDLFDRVLHLRTSPKHFYFRALRTSSVFQLRPSTVLLNFDFDTTTTLGVTTATACC